VVDDYVPGCFPFDVSLHDSAHEEVGYPAEEQSGESQ